MEQDQTSDAPSIRGGEGREVVRSWLQELPSLGVMSLRAVDRTKTKRLLGPCGVRLECSSSQSLGAG